MSGAPIGKLAKSDLGRWLSEADPLPPHDQAPEPARSTIERLYRERSGRLLRHLTRRTGNPADAQDLVQEAFARLTRVMSGQNAAAVAQPPAYLSTVTRNLLVDRVDAAVRKRSAWDLQGGPGERESTDPHRQLEARDMLRRLEDVMLSLRPRRRAIFLAHRLDNLSYAEIAEQHGLSVKRVAKEMSKAIADIDRMLERD